MKIDTKELALAMMLGATSWAIKTAFPGIPLDFAIPGSKIDIGWTPAILAAIWLGVKGGLITGFFYIFSTDSHSLFNWFFMDTLGTCCNRLFI